MVALPCQTNLRDNERKRVVDKGWEDGWRESRTSGSMNEWMDGWEMGKGKRESLLWRKYWQPVGSREDVEEGQVSQRVGRGMKGDEDRVPWVKKLISRWK